MSESREPITAPARGRTFQRAPAGCTRGRLPWPLGASESAREAFQKSAKRGRTPYLASGESYRRAAASGDATCSDPRKART